MLLPSRTPVTDGGGIVRRVPSRAISPLLVPAIIAQITGTSALILIAISASGLVLTNAMATTATGNDAIGLRCAAVSDLFSGQKADMLNFIRNVCFDQFADGSATRFEALTSDFTAAMSIFVQCQIAARKAQKAQGKIDTGGVSSALHLSACTCVKELPRA